MHHGFEGMVFGMGWGWIVFLFILTAVIWLVVRVSNQNTRQNSPDNKSALDVLKDRYARGEIGKEEFEEKKRIIHS